MKNKLFLVLLLLPVILSGCSSSSEPQTESMADFYNDSPQNPEGTEDTSEPNPENMTSFDQTALPQKGEQIVVMETNKGTVKIRLFPEFAPKTVENFVGLAKKGYYDGLLFHRVISGFMIQGGDPNGNGTGGQSLWGGKFENEISMNLSNIRGSLAMANAGKDTNGSQFFINQVDNTYLNGHENGGMKDCSLPRVSCHTVFGQVFEGMDIVDQITKVKTDMMDKPVDDVIMEKVMVENY